MKPQPSSRRSLHTGVFSDPAELNGSHDLEKAFEDAKARLGAQGRGEEDSYD